MLTLETRPEHDRVTAPGADVTSERGESLADRVLSFVAMAGSFGGALAGTVLGAGTPFPIACGTLGTMLGSGSAAAAWCLLVHLGPTGSPGITSIATERPGE